MLALPTRGSEIGFYFRGKNFIAPWGSLLQSRKSWWGAFLSREMLRRLQPLKGFVWSAAIFLKRSWQLFFIEQFLLFQEINVKLFYKNFWAKRWFSLSQLTETSQGIHLSVLCNCIWLQTPWQQLLLLVIVCGGSRNRMCILKSIKRYN